MQRKKVYSGNTNDKFSMFIASSILLLDVKL